MKPVKNKSGTYTVTYIPKVEGVHRVGSERSHAGDIPIDSS